MEKSKVYFTKELNPESVVKMYKALNKTLPEKVAVKVHSGEEGNQNYLRPEFLKPIVEYVNGTIVECNTAYEGERNYSNKHKKLLEKHGWNKYFNVDLMDEEGPDLKLDIPDGKVIKQDLEANTEVEKDSYITITVNSLPTEKRGKVNIDG